MDDSLYPRNAEEPDSPYHRSEDPPTDDGETSSWDCTADGEESRLEELSSSVGKQRVLEKAADMPDEMEEFWPAVKTKNKVFGDKH